MDTTKKKYLEKMASLIRIRGLEAIYQIKEGHIGGSFSIADILSVLYFDEMNVSADNQKDPLRDRFVLSKGHCTPTTYAALSLKGYFTNEELMTFRHLGSRLSGHMCISVPGVEASTGSLGQGFSVAVGMALSSKCFGVGNDVYVICGDGEIQEGQIWEGVMAAANQNLDNICLFVDSNKIQLDNFVNKICPSLYPIEDKFKAFGWNVHTINGHNIEEIKDTVDEFKKTRNGKPTVIIANTVKGKGSKILENKVKYHGGMPTEEEFKQIFKDLNEHLNKVEGE